MDEGTEAIVLGLVFMVSLTFESVGVATGLVCGPYHYTELLGLKFMGLAPYLIAVAWFMMMYPSFVMADWIAPNSLKGAGRLLAIAAIGVLVMTFWDVVLDPIMVAGKNWVWDVKGGYFGVPLQNFRGWWLTVFTTFMIYLLITRKGRSPAGATFEGCKSGWQRLMAAVPYRRGLRPPGPGAVYHHRLQQRDRGPDRRPGRPGAGWLLRYDALGNMGVGVGVGEDGEGEIVKLVPLNFILIV